MTEVSFHSGLPDKLGYACRLLRKAYRQGFRVVALGAPETLGQLDKALWTFEEEDFIPHRRLRRGEAPDERHAPTPIWLLDDEGADVRAQVLVNFGPELAAQPQRFDRVVELVGLDADDIGAGRARWRHYLAQGFTPVNLAHGAGADPPSE